MKQRLATRPSARALPGLACALLLAASATVASACPYCKEDNNDPSVNRREEAYGYSVLFMLAMPAAVITFIGRQGYKAIRRIDERNQARLDSPDEKRPPGGPQT